MAQPKKYKQWGKMREISIAIPVEHIETLDKIAVKHNQSRGEVVRVVIASLKKKEIDTIVKNHNEKQEEE